MIRKKLYKKYIFWAFIFTVFAFVSTAVIEKVLMVADTGDVKGGGHNPLGSIFGFFSFILLLETFVIGIPSVSKWIRGRDSLSRKQYLQLHGDLAYTGIVSVGLHVIFLSLIEVWKDNISWYSIYPWFYPGFAENWWNEGLALTLGSWAGFFMLTATVAGYFKNWIYKHWSRTTFIVIQNLTIITLIGTIFHSLMIGAMMGNNILMAVLSSTLSSILLILWIVYNIEMINKKALKSKNKKIADDAVAA